MSKTKLLIILIAMMVLMTGCIEQTSEEICFIDCKYAYNCDYNETECESFCFNRCYGFECESTNITIELEKI